MFGIRFSLGQREMGCQEWGKGLCGRSAALIDYIQSGGHKVPSVQENEAWL